MRHLRPHPSAQTQPQPAPAPPPPSQIKVGGDVQAARLLHEVTPQYPPLAKSARIGGVVHLSAIIAPDGTVKDLRVLSGNPLLVDAARERREAVDLSADLPEWQAGGSADGRRCQIHAGLGLG